MLYITQFTLSRFFPSKRSVGCIVLFLIPFLLISGCAKEKTAKPLPLEKTAELPWNLEFYFTPAKEYYLPYQRVTLTLQVKNNGSFENDLHINEKNISHIRLTPLSRSNSKYTYYVNWKDVPMNGHGYEGKTTRVTWYLPNNWAGIISQISQTNTVQFTIASPAGYWETKEYTVKIHVPKEEIVPYNDLLTTGCYTFLEHEYAVRMYNKNWSTYPQCPREQLPYNKLREYLRKYPYSVFTREIVNNLRKTVRTIKNEHTEYDVDDMAQVENLLKSKS